jgi:flagellar motor protein MotB
MIRRNELPHSGPARDERVAGHCPATRQGVSAIALSALALAVVLASGAALAATPSGAAVPSPAGVVEPSAPLRETAPLGAAVERQLPLYIEPSRWQQDDSLYQQNRGDRIETQQVQEQVVKTIKLPNVVPPIHYGSGAAAIPESYVGLLRDVLARMKGRRNVRLHFVGHSDNARLRAALQARFGDNVGLSRERAGTAAEFFQQALGLPPESIAYEGMGEAQPIASNATEAGKARNRRVEVQVWYDEIEEKTVEKQVVVTEQLNRIKVCRVETVCKLTYKEGHARRTRVKNLVPPLHFSGESAQVPEAFRTQVLQALNHLGDKQNVVVKLIGHTDDAPLAERDARIYGNHVGLSRARARRAVLALQDALKLPTAMIDSDGRGSANPIAANEAESGRALNRRVEVEFWYDDLLQELPDEPQLCPEAAAAETVTRVYTPPSGPLKPVLFDNGQPQVAADYLERLRGILAEVKDRTNVRLRFIGYTPNERLDRRTAMVYGDDIGLSSARARRVLELVQPALGLNDAQVESEGRGYVQTDDVVNAGFVESAIARVEVQVVYDELAAMDDLDAMDIQRLTREITPANPYALNLMRITVDGRPLDDPQKGTPDVQRCTDVALEKADVQFKFDNLHLKPRLNATAWPASVRYQDDPATDAADNRVQFRVYSNYPAFIDRAEIRLFEAGKALRDTPLAVVPVDAKGRAEWLATFDRYQAPGRELQYLLRVYDKAGRFDETAAQALWVLDRVEAKTLTADAEAELLVGYGENRLARQDIPLNGGTIRVHGTRIPAGRHVFVAGRAVPVAASGEFVVEEVLPAGLHTVEVAVLDAAGNGDLFLRDLELQKSDWFYVAIADLTASLNDTSGPAALVTNDSAHYDNDLSVDGRLAFFTQGKFGRDWQLTASADTLDGPVEDLFSNFMQKSPDALFRRIDPDYAYPTFGDDSTVEEGAPTLGKFYLKLKRDDDYGLWGNFRVAYTDNSLAHVDRNLYGGNAHYETDATTSFGEKRFAIDGFVADPGTVAGRDEFRGTGGSVYYLRHQDLLTGSERVRIEVRDKVSGLVLAVKNLTPALDYDIDYLQGRVMLTEPLSPVSADGLLVSSEAGGGNEVYLVTRYEYSTNFDEVGNLSAGGRVHYWVGDFLKVGLTANDSSEPGNANRLGAGDITLRRSADTWFRAELSESEGAGASAFLSNDGGFNFGAASTGALPGFEEQLSAGASRFDASLGFRDVFPSVDGKLTVYQQTVEAGYAAPGLITGKETEQVGVTVAVPVTARVDVRAKLDSKTQVQGLDTEAAELNVDYRLTERWQLSSGLRQENREDNSPLVPLTQVEGERTDAVLRAAYDSKGRWTAYGYVQDTLEASGNQDDNGRVGAGGAWRVTDRFKTSAEASSGDMGTGAKVGTEYLVTDRSNVYLNYALENERSDNGVRAQRGNLASGVRSHWSDTTSVYLEERYTHGDVPTGLTHATGIDLAPNDRWNYGASLDVGTLRDNQTGAELERQALGLKLGYAFAAVKFASVLEWRTDTLQQLDLSTAERQTWLTKNSVKYQFTPDWRFIGKLNYSDSKSSLGEFYDGRFIEAVAGYGFRPVSHDRLNALAKYTYFYNLPTADQVTIANTAAEFIQKSHVFSVDSLYDLTARWSVGGKIAYRLGQVSQDRANPTFFDSRATLGIVRADWHVMRHWDATLEARQLDLPDAGDRRSGVLVAGYRHLNEHVKFGAGYNFSSFSDDLTDLSYDHQGFFLNLVGKL